MKRKAVLLLQGGGALGAFQCGAWQALHPFLRENGIELVAVAGASIGATNAALIARHCHDDDGGCGALQEFWHRTVATPPTPFIPLPGEYWRAWNGLLTGLLLGNRALFRPMVQHWNPFAGSVRFHLPLYSTRSAERVLAQAVGEYRGRTPLLAVGATDIESGEAVLFDSAHGSVTPKMLAASIAIPLLFSPVEIDGRHYWDAEMRSNTLLQEVFGLLRHLLPRAGPPEEFLVIVVDMFSASALRTPDSAIESQYRLMNIFLGGKLHHDRRVFETGNAYLEAIERLRDAVRRTGSAPLAAAVDEEYRRALACQPGRVEILHVGRRNLAYEHISRDFDYSPSYIARLMEQGYASAEEALDRFEVAHRTENAPLSVSRPAPRAGDEKGAGSRVDRETGTGADRAAYPRIV